MLLEKLLMLHHVLDYTILKDLSMKTVTEEATHFHKRFDNRLQTTHIPRSRFSTFQLYPATTGVVSKGTGAVTCLNKNKRLNLKVFT